MFKSSLFNEKNFYPAFIRDLQNCKQEVVIESPYISQKRITYLLPTLQRLVERGVKVHIVTRDPSEHTQKMAEEAELAIQFCEEVGVQVLICPGNHHRKMAYLDRSILYEGSLNILSQNASREFMRRIDDKIETNLTLKFLRLDKYL
jgi:phosphatidylserine/phosphatidylglycerophosphate/cardiolipin synthase-like enzyme